MKPMQNWISIPQKSVPRYKCWHQCGMRTMIYYQEILDNTTPHRQLATEKFPDHRMRYWLQHHQQQQQSN